MLLFVFFWTVADFLLLFNMALSFGVTAEFSLLFSLAQALYNEGTFLYPAHWPAVFGKARISDSDLSQLFCLD